MKSYFSIILVLFLCGTIYGQFEKVSTKPVHQHRGRALALHEVSAGPHVLSNNYDVAFYRFDLSAGNTSAHLEGSVTIGATSKTSSLDTFACELVDYYTIDSVLIDGEKCPLTRSGHDVFVVPQSPIGAGSLFEATFYYSGEIPKNIQDADFGISNNPAYKITYTLSEPYFAKYWFPCKQDLLDKADSVMINVVTDSGLVVGSNGLLVNRMPLDEGKVLHQWRSSYPIAYYLISLCIGDYQEYSYYAPLPDANDSVLVQNYLYNNPGVLDANQYYLDLTGELIYIFSELYGPYPFAEEKYGHCMAPFPGGMEHQTMSTMVGFDFELVAHELAHQWFGDMVTCATWQDIWINEGFATYSPFLALERLGNQFPIQLMQQYVNEVMASAPSGSVFIPESEFAIDYTDFNDLYNLTWRIFSWPLSYAKGAIILHMLRHEINNDELFFNILRTYGENYRFSNATGADFREIAENTTGLDLRYFFDQWYYDQGYPVFRIRWYQEGDELRIESRQGPSVPGGTFFRLTMDYYVRTSAGDTLLRLEQTEAIQTYSIPVDGQVAEINANPYANVLARIEQIHEETFAPATITGEQDKHGITIWPNPAAEYIWVSNPDNLSGSITILDHTGRKLLTCSLENGTTELPVYKLTSGAYIIRILTDDEQHSETIIVGR